MSRYSTNATRDDPQRLSTVAEDDSQYGLLTIGYKATPTPKARGYSTINTTGITRDDTKKEDPKQIITDPSNVGTIRIGTTVSKREADRDLAEQWRLSLKSRTDSGRLGKIGWEK